MGIKKILIYKDKVKRKQFLKFELKRLILLSILQNFQINEIVRLQAHKKLIMSRKKSWISKQNNICIITARYGGVFKLTETSRHQIKKFAKLNMLHNIKIKSW